jgi:uncharacterized protein YjbI with pentapeptide repeats
MTPRPIFGHMADGKPRQSSDPLYLLLRAGEHAQFNSRRHAGETCDLRGCDFRGIDLRDFDVRNLDLADTYCRQADLRGLDLRTCNLAGASLHAAHVSGVFFPSELSPQEIQMSVLLGTRLRYTIAKG